MFPLRWNFPFRKKDGSMVNLEDAMSGGGGGYTLPTASAETKGGVKIGSGLTMTGEVLSVTGGGGGGTMYLHQMTFRNSSQGTSILVVQFFKSSSTAITKQEMFDLLYNSGTPIILFGINGKTSSSSNPIQSITAQITDGTEEFVFKEASSTTRSSVTNVVFTDEVIQVP